MIVHFEILYTSGKAVNDQKIGERSWDDVRERKIMIDKETFHIFNFIKKEEYTGSMEGVRYMLRKGEEGGELFLEVFVWPKPTCFGKTPEEKKRRKKFSFSETGVEDAADWLNEQSVLQKKLWSDRQDSKKAN